MTILAKHRRFPGRFLGLMAWLSLLAAVGCDRSNVRSDLDRRSRSDEDLVALLPRGLEAVLDVDVAGLRKLDAAAELVGFLPERMLSRLAIASEGPLRSLDALAVGMLGMGSSDADVVWIARGIAGPGPEGGVYRERVFAEVRKLGAATEAEYHGRPLIETQDGQAAAILNERTVAYGNRQTVRQIVDIFRGDEEGSRKQADLAAVLAKAPRAKTGRPAIMLGLLLPPPLRERLRQLGLPEFGTDAEYLAASLAVGDGIDLGVVAGFQKLSVAEEAGRQLQARAVALKQRPALMFLGVQRYVQPLVAVAVPALAAKGRQTPELHLAYRLPGDALTELLSRLVRLQQMQQKLQGKPAEKQ